MRPLRYSINVTLDGCFSLGKFFLGYAIPDKSSLDCHSFDDSVRTLHVNQRTGRVSLEPFVLSNEVMRVRQPRLEEGRGRAYRVRRFMVRVSQGR
jgi:hypothetical protein